MDDNMAEMTREEEAEKLVDENTRDELDEMAKELGIKDAQGLPRKMAVAKEIVRKRRAKEYAKKPTGLYIEKD